MSIGSHLPRAGDFNLAVPQPPLLSRARNWVIWGVLIALLVWSWGPAEMSKISGLVTHSDNIVKFAADFTRPDFSDWRDYVQEMVVTVQIALWATVLAVIIGIPFSILSASNICPQWVVQPTRRLMDAIRAVPEIIFAIFFLVAVGLGPIAGVLALTVHNIGIVAKLFSEAVEAIDPRPVEGVRATGASRLQEVIFGVIPQVMPLWSSYALYRFDTNVRSATVLGIIGAGGIGQVLYESSRSFLYPQTSAIIIVVMITIILVDILSAFIRKSLV